MGISLLRIKAVKARTGLSRSTLYAYVKLGLFVPPVKIGSQAAAWPEQEVDAINQARVAGATTVEIESLVRALVARRRQAFNEFRRTHPEGP